MRFLLVYIVTAFHPTDLIEMEFRLQAVSRTLGNWFGGNLVNRRRPTWGISDWMMGLKSACWQGTARTPISWPPLLSVSRSLYKTLSSMLGVLIHRA